MKPVYVNLSGTEVGNGVVWWAPRWKLVYVNLSGTEVSNGVVWWAPRWKLT